VGGAKQKLPLADSEIHICLKERQIVSYRYRQSFRRVGHSLCSVRRSSLPVRPSAFTLEKGGSSFRASRETADWSSVRPAVLRGQQQLRIKREQLQVVDVCSTGSTKPPNLAQAEGHCQSLKKCTARDRHWSRETVCWPS